MKRYIIKKSTGMFPCFYGPYKNRKDAIGVEKAMIEKDVKGSGKDKDFIAKFFDIHELIA